jgi:hypothetical protein
MEPITALITYEEFVNMVILTWGEPENLVLLMEDVDVATHTAVLTDRRLLMKIPDAVLMDIVGTQQSANGTDISHIASQ